MADAAQDASGLLHDLLSSVIPDPVFRVLAGFSNLIYTLLGSANNPASWSSTLLPPLITFFLAYFALLTAYRTVRSMLSLAWFGIKWGAIIGGLIAIWAWWTDNTDAINSTGTVPGRGGFFGQLNSLGPLMNTLYTQLPDLTTSGGSSASARNARRRQQRSSSTRRRTRANKRAFSFDANDDLADDLGAGYSAFADMFGRSSDTEPSDGGVDFGSLLRTVVTEGQRQGIDALSALRAAGKVQDELRRFQQDPSGWFQGVGDRFRTTAGVEEGTAYNTRSRTRQQQQQRRRRRGDSNANANQGDSWWGNVASGVNDFFKRDPDEPVGGARSG